MINSFIVRRRLPSLNDYITACRSGWMVGAKFKDRADAIVVDAISKAMADGTLRRVRDDEYPVEISIQWQEVNRKRDVDNIQSGQKYILDALQKAHIIRNDNMACVSQVHHNVTIGNEPCAMVVINPNQPS